MSIFKKQDFLCWLSLFFISSAWHYPGTWICAALTWIGCLLLCSSLPNCKKPYSTLYSSGIALYAIGFYWLFFTIRDFGGFGTFISTLIFIFFLICSAVQFLIFVFIWKNLPKFFHNNCLAVAFAWVAAEVLSIKIFPWCLGHSQLAITYLAQLAEIAGAVPISFIVIWTSDVLIRTIKEKRASLRFAACSVALCCSIIFGYIRVKHFTENKYTPQNVTLIQANISLEEKHDMRFPKINMQRYIELSKPYAGKDTLLIWPESVLTEFVSANLKHVREEPYAKLPYFEGTPLLMGGLTYESRENMHNSAIGIGGDGSIRGVYHKQVLMPFGEYMPFSNYFPWLKDINSAAGEFTAGKNVDVIELDSSTGKSVKISPLICYEDVIPGLAREATVLGAEILINLTNDAWFGNTIAPFQHNLIASFRAIENRRFLLRSTNTGLTAIINPLGQQVAHLEPYSEGVLNFEVSKINFRALSSHYDFQYIVWISALIILGTAIVGRYKNET